MRSHDIGDDSFTIRAARLEEVPAYLSASDAGIAFIKPCFSKLASSPTKYAEYLACGLPIVLNAGIGDSDALVTKYSAGALITEFSESEYERAANIVTDFAANSEITRARLRELAGKLFDISTVGLNRYAQLYREVFAA
jgi:glycosyltransferase involved in cell wall biosynthesis